MALDPALQYHLGTVENLILRSTFSISHILTKAQGRHDSHVQKSFQGRHLWLGRRQTNLRRVDNLFLNWQFFASTLMPPQCSSSETMANYFSLCCHKGKLFHSGAINEGIKLVQANFSGTFYR